MTTEPSPTLRIILDSLDRLHPLSEQDRAAVEALPFRVATYPAHRHLVREGERPDQCGLLLEGYACRHKLAASGARQIVAFNMPGDVLDAQHLELRCADHNIQTITPATVALVARRDLQRAVDVSTAVREALWRRSLIEASAFREWVLNVGRREALARVAHVLCVFAARREEAGLGPPGCFELPMTQEQIGDATGLTAVHVNRMLQSLGAMGVIARDRRQVTIVDWAKLRAIADFDPAYLHLPAQPASAWMRAPAR